MTRPLRIMAKKRVKLLKSYRGRPAGLIMELQAAEAMKLVKDETAEPVTATDKGRK